MANRTSNTLIWLVIALVVSIAIMAIVGALTFNGNDTGFGMMGGGSWGWAMALMIIPIVLLIVIIVVALGGVEDRPQYGSYPQPPQTPIDILNQRLARGEISHEEYDKIRAKLGQ